MRSRTKWAAAAALAAAVLVGLMWKAPGEKSLVPDAGPGAAVAPDGAAAFAENCAKCHGEAGIGTDRGPPLVHQIYEPNHHADTSFFIAVRQGARSHHWPFGDMPPLPEVSDAEVFAIIAYIRAQQRAAGIF